jgi:hypothetical protein
VDVVIGVCIGLGLSAACGFRVFVPMLVMSLAAKAGYLEPAEGFRWMDSWGAVAAFGTATLLESVAYYVPWLDHLLDSVASPAAVVAGIVTTAACVADADPMVQWSAAIIGGAGVAGAIQSSSVAARAASTLTTGGLGNFFVATAELVGSVAMSLLAFLVPVVAALMAVGLTVLAVVVLLWVRRRVFGPRRANPRASG